MSPTKPRFEIVERQSLGPVHLGMPTEVLQAKMLEAPRIIPNRRNEEVWHFRHLSAVIVDNRVVEVTADNSTQLVLQGICIFEDADALARLVLLEQPSECLGFLIFERLQIMITGLHDSDKGQQVVTLLDLDRLDSLRHRFKPFV